jgi:hypothetical protein
MIRCQNPVNYRNAWKDTIAWRNCHLAAVAAGTVTMTAAVVVIGGRGSWSSGGHNILLQHTLRPGVK